MTCFLHSILHTSADGQRVFDKYQQTSLTEIPIRVRACNFLFWHENDLNIASITHRFIQDALYLFILSSPTIKQFLNKWQNKSKPCHREKYCVNAKVKQKTDDFWTKTCVKLRYIPIERAIGGKEMNWRLSLFLIEGIVLHIASEFFSVFMNDAFMLRLEIMCTQMWAALRAWRPIN